MKALENASVKEFSQYHIPSESTHSVVSDNKVIPSLEKISHRMHFRRRFLAIVVALLVLLAALMSIGAVRKPVIEFFREIFAVGTNYCFFTSNDQNDSYDIIETAYTPRKIPEGFRLTIKDTDETSRYFRWQNEKYDSLSFSQYTPDVTLSINSADAVEKTVTVQGYTATLFTHPKRQFLLWNTERYVFLLALYGPPGIVESGTVDLVAIASDMMGIEA